MLESGQRMESATSVDASNDNSAISGNVVVVVVEIILVSRNTCSNCKE
jgi:hypothetical protein